MLKTNKLVSLGVLSVIGLGLAVAPTVSAANNSNTTTFGYTAGQAGGGDDSDWVLDMPTQVNLSDKNIGQSQTAGKVMTFNLYNAYSKTGNKKEAYTGDKTVTVKVDAISASGVGNVENNEIPLKASDANRGNGVVKMTLHDSSDGTIEVSQTGSKNNIATLKKQSTTSSIKATIAKSGNAAKGDTFTSTLTWAISDGSQQGQ